MEMVMTSVEEGWRQGDSLSGCPTYCFETIVVSSTLRINRNISIVSLSRFWVSLVCTSCLSAPLNL